MKLRFQRDTLLNALTPMLGSVSGKNTLPSISGILFDAEDKEDCCVLSSYDLEKGMQTEISCRIEEKGKVVLGAVKLVQILRTMPNDTVKIEVNESNMKATVSAGQATFEFSAIPGNDFPSMPFLEGDHGFMIRKKDLSRMIGRIMSAVAQNDSRPCLNGAFFRIKGNSITTVGCNGNCLSMSEMNCDLQITTDTSELNMEFIIPGKTLSEMMKLLSDSEETVELQLTRKHVILKTEGFVLFSRLIEQEYVDYTRFLPKASKTFTDVSREELISSLERAMLVTEDRLAGQAKSPVRLIFEENVLTVRSDSIASRVEDTIPIKLQGDGLEIGFNCRLLMEALKVADGENLHLSLTSALMSMIIEPVEKKEDDHYLLLVLPVRLGGK